MDAVPAPAPPALDALLAERAWVRSLARTLVLDRNDADDLEQDAWVAALDRPPRDASSPRGWLASVLRRGASRGRRSDARVARRERVAARPEAVMGTADLVALAEQHRRVVGLVLDLDEPYRSTLLARFFEGLPPREIAARAGEPAKTIASRLARGLEQIRARLDRESRGDRRAWVAALAPLAGLDLGGGGAPASGPHAVGPGAASSIVTGGLLMGAKGKIAAVAALVLLVAGAGAWWVLRERSTDGIAGPAPAAESVDAGATATDAPRLASAPPGNGGARASAAVPPDPTPTSPAEPAMPAGMHVGVRAVERVDGRAQPIAATIKIQSATSGSIESESVRGEYVYASFGDRASPVAAWAWAPGHALGRVELPRAEGLHDVELARGRRVEIRFVSATTGRPVPMKARFEAFAGRPVARTSSPRAPEPMPRDDGEPPGFGVRIVPADRAQVHAVKDMVRRASTPESFWQLGDLVAFEGETAWLSIGFAEPGAMVLVPRPGDEPYLATVRDDGGDHLVTTVPIRDDVPTAHVRCVAAEDGAPVPSAMLTPYAEAGDDALFVPGALVVADARGEADLPLPGPPPPGMRSPTWWARAEGRAAMVATGALVAARGATVTIELARTATIRGRAYLRSGAPAAGKTVIVGNKGNYETAVVGEDGSFELRHVVVRASIPDPTAKLMLIEDVDALAISFGSARVEPGGTTEVQIGRPASAGGTGRIRGRVTTGGQPLAGVLVAAGSETAGRAMSSTDADGRYSLAGLTPGDTPFMMALGDPGVSDDAGLRTDKALRVDANADATLDFDLPAGALRVKVVDDKTGKPVPGAMAWIAPESHDVEKDRFPGFLFRPGWSALADENGVVIARALPLNAPLQVEGGTKDRGLKGATKGVFAGDAANPPEVVLRIAPTDHADRK